MVSLSNHNGFPILHLAWDKQKNQSCRKSLINPHTKKTAYQNSKRFLLGHKKTTALGGFLVGISHTLDDGADALTQANTHGRQAKLRVLLFHYI